MVETVFRAVLRMSFYGLAAGAVTCGMCRILKHLPVSRRVGFLLWAVVGLRLVCPLSLPLTLPGFGVGQAVEEALEFAGARLESQLQAAGLIGKNRVMGQMAGMGSVPDKAERTGTEKNHLRQR